MYFVSQTKPFATLRGLTVTLAKQSKILKQEIKLDYSARN